MHSRLLIIISTITVPTWGYICQQCSPVRYAQFGGFPAVQKRYNFNFDQFFSQGNFGSAHSPKFNSYGVPSSQRIFNMYGQDAEAFGSAIGKSIAQRIRQAYGQQEPSSSPPMTSSSSAPSSPSSPVAFDDVQLSSSSSGMHAQTSPQPFPSTHPPEDLPTVQEAYQQSLSPTPSMLMSPPGGFGGLPGMLPMPTGSASTNCPWCTQNGGFRSKRKENE